MALATEPLTAIELRLMAQSWLAMRHPDAVIVTEMSVADWGGASIDIAAITDSHIVGVEIKGEGDSPARLDRQGLAYGMVAKEMWLLPCPSLAKKCYLKLPKGWGKLEVWGDKVRPFNCATKSSGRIPIKGRAGSYKYESLRDDDRYEPDSASICGHLCPAALCGTLWREELMAIASRTSVTGLVRSSYVHLISEALENQLPAPILHDEMIRELRGRRWKKEVIDLREPEGQLVSNGHLLL